MVEKLLSMTVDQIREKNEAMISEEKKIGAEKIEIKK